MHMALTAPTRTALEDLDVALVRLRRFWQRPQLKARVLTELGGGVTPSRYNVVRAVAMAEAPEPCVGDVAAALDVDASTASRFVADAVDAGLLARSTSERDRRRSRLEVTAAGRALLDRGADVRRALLGEMTAGWDEEDVARLAHLLGRLGDAARDAGSA
jgi:DNA-binding MarR family transcriptional regulator